MEIVRKTEGQFALRKLHNEFRKAGMPPTGTLHVTGWIYFQKESKEWIKDKGFEDLM